MQKQVAAVCAVPHHDNTNVVAVTSAANIVVIHVLHRESVGGIGSFFKRCHVRAGGTDDEERTVLLVENQITTAIVGKKAVSQIVESGESCAILTDVTRHAIDVVYLSIVNQVGVRITAESDELRAADFGSGIKLVFIGFIEREVFGIVGADVFGGQNVIDRKVAFGRYRTVFVGHVVIVTSALVGH